MSADPQAIADAIDHLITTRLMVEKHLLYDSAVIKAKADLFATLDKADSHYQKHATAHAPGYNG